MDSSEANNFSREPRRDFPFKLCGTLFFTASAAFSTRLFATAFKPLLFCVRILEVVNVDGDFRGDASDATRPGLWLLPTGLFNLALKTCVGESARVLFGGALRPIDGGDFADPGTETELASGTSSLPLLDGNVWR
jgi:hypothetical protein